MNNLDVQMDLIKQLEDYRSKAAALYSLYNNSLLIAESNRGELTVNYEKMVDCKNDLSNIVTTISKASRTEREEVLAKNQSKIKKIDKDVDEANRDFEDIVISYRGALKECGSLKTDYKHDIQDICKNFKSIVTEDTNLTIKQAYVRQVKALRTTFDKIEGLISNYNVNKNKVDMDYDRFKDLYANVHTLISQLQAPIRSVV